ncbi:hypothetical protein TL18_02310 [Methanobrevibacter sp. YE315]|uniref:hypothetical protein n=1 Tax=Methanobrevibacter sp. YE315 TaxID=1609968 RepID=UPI000764E282|nr:hypothetical protein [Methanobrevibacter sp. YE315]AMD16957.1 hypothetical protein TL18_02310 [Methanobrevibacter sp. YE315]
MDSISDINIKALIFGAAIAAAFILFGYQYWDWFYPFSAIGLLYAGYGQKNVITGTVMGALASTPIVVLTLQGYLGTFEEGFFTTETGVMTVMIIILVIGAFVGFVGAWTKRNRVKAMEEYEKKQNIGKKKNKKNKIEKK